MLQYFFYIGYLILTLLYIVSSASSYYNVPPNLVPMRCTHISFVNLSICFFKYDYQTFNKVIVPCHSMARVNMTICWDNWKYGSIGGSIVPLPCVGSGIPRPLPYPLPCCLALLVSISLHTCRKMKQPLYTNYCWTLANCTICFIKII